MSKYDILELAAVIADEQRQAEIVQALVAAYNSSIDDIKILNWAMCAMQPMAAAANQFAADMKATGWDIGQGVAAGVRPGPLRIRPPRRIARRAHSRRMKK